MASTPCPTLEDYNSLLDPSLANYFSNPRIRSHLKKIGLINRKGELRSETEILAYNAEIKQKSQFNDLLSRAIILKAAELDRQRQHELKKLSNEFEKKERVRKARENKNKMDYTKALSAKFYVDDGIEDDEEEDSPHDATAQDEVKLTLPHAVPVPDGDQVYSMAKLMHQKKIMSPYLNDGSRPNTVGGHALPTLVHDRVQAKIYGSGGASKFKRRPTSNASRASYIMGPKKSVTISSINRLARSKLPGIDKTEKKGAKNKRAGSAKVKVSKLQRPDSGVESASPVKEQSVRSSTPTKQHSRSSSSSSSHKDVQIKIEDTEPAPKSLSSSHASSPVPSHHNKTSSSESRTSLHSKAKLPALSRSDSSESGSSQEAEIQQVDLNSSRSSSKSSQHALPSTVVPSQIEPTHESKISKSEESQEEDEGFEPVDLNSSSSSSSASKSSQNALPDTVVQSRIEKSLSSSSESEIEPVDLNSSKSSQNALPSTVSLIENTHVTSETRPASISSTRSSQKGLPETTEPTENVKEATFTRSVSASSASSEIKAVSISSKSSAAPEEVATPLSKCASLSSTTELENAPLTNPILVPIPHVSKISSTPAPDDIQVKVEQRSNVTSATSSKSELGFEAELLQEAINEVEKERTTTTSRPASSKVSKLEPVASVESLVDSISSSRSSGVEIPASSVHHLSKSRISLLSTFSNTQLPLTARSVISKASAGNLPSSSSESESEAEEVNSNINARSTAETKASAYSLPSTPLVVQKKQRDSSNSLSSSLSSLSSSSSEKTKSKASSALFAAN